jgi:2-polyprenyl-3-methyl-5-hydroxy-6-metoxy-1,4-benzoquinol methylase
MNRGGQPHLEVFHARQLLDTGVEDVWGWNSPAGKERVNARANWLTEVLGLKPGISVLECGCGTGVFTRCIAKTGAKITAVDISCDLLTKARKRCPAKNVTFVETNLENPEELQDEPFDALCGVSVLHHLMLPKALVALRKKLKPHGRFAFSEPNLLNPINKYIFTNDPERRRKLGISPTEMAFYPKELRAIFEEVGFEVCKLEHRDFLHFAVPKVLISIVKTGQLIAERTPILQRWSGSLWITGVKL